MKKMRMAWKDVQDSTGFKKSLIFLVFVAIAALFWFILALNDSVQDDFEVKVNIYNVPDSVTFITIPPQKIHVMVRDQGTNLWRNGVFGNAQVNIDFKDFSSDGQFKMRHSELTAALKNVFGPSASLLSSSVDSLSLTYTTLPGKRVPVVVSANLSTAVGKIISERPTVTPSSVVVYSIRSVIDTISKVYSEHFSRQNLEETIDVPVKLQGMPNVRMEPSAVNVKVEVEPLVKKRATVNLQVQNLPEGMDLLLFPSVANVEYYLPMSRFNATSDDRIEVSVDFEDIHDDVRKLPVNLVYQDQNLLNLQVLTDSVEYTLVRN